MLSSEFFSSSASLKLEKAPKSSVSADSSSECSESDVELRLLTGDGENILAENTDDKQKNTGQQILITHHKLESEPERDPEEIFDATAATSTISARSTLQLLALVVDEDDDDDNSNETTNLEEKQSLFTENNSSPVKEEDESDEDSGSESGTRTISRKSMFIQHAKELLCILALALTTYAALQNGPPKIGRPPPPNPFFPAGSLVQDWPGGQLAIVQTRVAASELSLVYFYAPWCAESQHARSAYEAVAKLYYRDAYFAAINCWQPGGECRLQYAKVHVWPVLMAYYPQGLAIQYQGPWSAPALSKFVSTLMNPYKRITDPDELLQMLINGDAVVVGFFNSTQLANKFQIFFQAAVKWLEKDPFGELEFGVVTGSSAISFGVTETPVIRMYLWNETLEYKYDAKWSVEAINKWITDKLHFVSVWMSPPGRKSTLLSPYLKDSPSLLMFTPRDHYSDTKDGYHLLKQVALEYYNCDNDTWISEIATKYIPAHRDDNRNELLGLKLDCNKLYQSENDFNNFDDTSCRTQKATPSHVAFSFVLNNSKDYDSHGRTSVGKNSNEFCYGPKEKQPSDRFSSNHQCDEFMSHENKFSTHLKDNKPSGDEIDKVIKTSMLNSEYDKRSPGNIVKLKKMRLCKNLLLSDKNAKIFFKNDNQNVNLIRGMACSVNNSLSFLMLDSLYYNMFTDRLGVDLLHMPQKSAVVLLDNENDSTFQLKGEISEESISAFVKDFHSGNLLRKFRKSKSKHESAKQHVNKNVIDSDGSSRASLKQQIVIRELNSQQFNDYIDATNRTAVVLFYSTQCALCSLFSQTLLTVAKILQTLDIDFFRIDGDRNDLLWEYTMENYPTLVIFPHNRKLETRTFPQSLEVNAPNVLGFIMANLNNTERLDAMNEACRFTKKGVPFEDCIVIFRNEISNDISLNLRYWRHLPHLRTEIIRRLQILQKIYLISFQIKNSCDLDQVKKDILLLNKVWKK